MYAMQEVYKLHQENVSVPREPFSFGGWNKSFYGFGDLTGTGGIEFWTRREKITSKWFVRKARTWRD